LRNDSGVRRHHALQIFLRGRAGGRALSLSQRKPKKRQQKQNKDNGQKAFGSARHFCAELRSLGCKKYRKIIATPMKIGTKGHITEISTRSKLASMNTKPIARSVIPGTKPPRRRGVLGIFFSSF
jgi:hypothetical protein